MRGKGLILTDPGNHITRAIVRTRERERKQKTCVYLSILILLESRVGA